MTLFMTHPDSPGHAPAVTTQNAFDKVWAQKGWQLVDDNATPAPEPSELRGQALDQALTDAGLPTTGSAAEKRAALADHYAAQGA